MKKIFCILSCAVVAINVFGSTPSWSPAGDRIRTPWADDVNPQSPLPEYPRPQMVRPEWQNLNGLWNYAITPENATDFETEGQILVPFAVESSLSGVGRFVGKEKALWYERTFSVPKTWKGRDVILHFGAVDWKADVWVNGIKAGEHTGGYTPFSFNVTPLLKKSGKQTLRVRVWDASDDGFQPRGKQVSAPAGIWYTPVTGIWQTVWMEPVSSARIVSYYPESDIEKGFITVGVSAEGLQDGDKIQVELLDGAIGYNPETPSRSVIASAEGPVAVVKVPQVKLWSPDSPYLYGLRISIMRDGKVVDSVDGYTSMRKISMKKDGSLNHYKRMALNNEALFHYGPLDQGWWPDGLYTAPTDEALRFDIRKTKDFGFNMIRKHIKVEPARWYYWCDVLGIMVWQDMPCIGDHSRIRYGTIDPSIAEAQANKWVQNSVKGGTDCRVPEVWKKNYYKEWGEIIDACKPFQCIVVWVPFNEAWGQFDTPEVVEFTRRQDRTRLVNESSGGNFHFCGDIIDLHHYPWPGMNVFDYTFVNVLGEYGGIGLPVEGHLWKNSDKNWGYGGVKKDGADVLKNYRDYAGMLKTFITTGCSAAVYTQTTDVEVEVNGLMTYDRKVIKVDEKELSEINRSVIESMAK